MERVFAVGDLVAGDRHGAGSAERDAVEDEGDQAAEYDAGRLYRIAGDDHPILRAEGIVKRPSEILSVAIHDRGRGIELAIAMATNPRLLLLDEPLAGTGHEESAVVTELLRELKGEHTIVLIEHDMEAVFALADRISVLDYGKLITTGEPEAVRADRQVRGLYLGEEEAI